MFRLACGMAVIAFIFAHSPERPKTGLHDEAGRLTDWMRREFAEAAVRSALARDGAHPVSASTDRAALR